MMAKHGYTPEPVADWVDYLDREVFYEDDIEPSAGKVKAAKPAGAFHREPFEHEIRAAVDFELLDEAWQAALDDLVAAWRAVQARQVAELERAIAAAETVEDLAAIVLEPEEGDVAVVATVLTVLAAVALRDAVAEAEAQGIASPPEPSPEDYMPAVLDRAKATAMLLTGSLEEAATRHAANRWGGDMGPDEVARMVRAKLDALTEAFVAKQAAHALTATQNTVRLAVADRQDGLTEVYASEIRDRNTCGPCRRIDGMRFASIAEAKALYPIAGFVGCEGDILCRGGLVFIYDETSDGTGNDPVAASRHRGGRVESRPRVEGSRMSRFVGRAFGRSI